MEDKILILKRMGLDPSKLDSYLNENRKYVHETNSSLYERNSLGGAIDASGDAIKKTTSTISKTPEVMKMAYNKKLVADELNYLYKKNGLNITKTAQALDKILLRIQAVQMDYNDQSNIEFKDELEPEYNRLMELKEKIQGMINLIKYFNQSY